MRTNFLLWLICGVVVLQLSDVFADASEWREAAPGHSYEFPRDHGAHADYKIEWWYYTGNVRTAEGRRFGYQLTFFRSGGKRETRSPSRWAVRDLYMAHFALSDLDSGRFYFFDRLNRAGITWAGVKADGARIWNEDWEARVTAKGHAIKARADGVALDLLLEPLKPPVIHGADGVSRKGAEEGNASHYYSLTRLKSTGSIDVDGTSHRVQGLSWMDHEFGTSFLEESDVGWDWLYVQLKDGRDLMFFVIRRKDGGTSPFSSGALIDEEGRSRGLTAREFTLRPETRWTSPASEATYPVGWTLSVPGEDLTLKIDAAMIDQELRAKKSTGFAYWEGSTQAKGHWGERAVTGSGYLEMTGYSGKSMASVFR